MSELVKINGTPPTGNLDSAVPSSVAIENVSPLIMSKEKARGSVDTVVIPTEHQSDVMGDEESPIPVEETKAYETLSESDLLKISSKEASSETSATAKEDSSDLLKISSKEDSPETPAPAKEDSAKNLSEEDFAVMAAEDDLLKTPVKDESYVEMKRAISPIFPPSSEKRHSRLSRRTEGLKKKQEERVNLRAKFAPCYEVETSMPKKGKVISLASAKTPKDFEPEKKRIVLKRQASSSYDAEFPESSKPSSDEPPKKKQKHKPITWP